MKAVLGVVAAIVVLAVAFFGYQYWQLSQSAVQWEGAEEVAFESLEQDGSTWKIEYRSVIDKPVDQVWAAVQQPERSSQYIDSFKKSELKKHEGNQKVVQLQVQVLTLPLQTVLMQFTFDEANKRVQLKSLQSATQDIDASYELKPSPDGQKTLFTYRANARTKISIPLPVSAQKGAFKELFVKTIRAIKKGIEEDQAQAEAAA